MYSSCSEQEPYLFEHAVEAELIQYFNSFATEAQARNVLIDWEHEQISAKFSEIEGDAVGQCLTFDQGSREIVIDTEFWQSSNTISREFLVFHELGHCVLGRAHLDASAGNGICSSMMTSGEGTCRANYNQRTREDYLDELFLN